MFSGITCRSFLTILAAAWSGDADPVPNRRTKRLLAESAGRLVRTSYRNAVPSDDRARLRVSSILRS